MMKMKLLLSKRIIKISPHWPVNVPLALKILICVRKYAGVEGHAGWSDYLYLRDLVRVDVHVHGTLLIDIVAHADDLVHVRVHVHGDVAAQPVMEELERQGVIVHHHVHALR